MKDIIHAIDEGLIDYFTMKPANGKRINISGQVLARNEVKVFVSIFGNLRYVKENHKNENYDINFLVNRQPFKLQHQALDLFQKHSLFSCLINNPRYEMNIVCDAPTPFESR